MATTAVSGEKSKTFDQMNSVELAVALQRKIASEFGTDEKDDRRAEFFMDVRKYIKFMSR